MRVKIHVELITDWEEATIVEACEFARPMTEFTAETIGLSLDDGKRLLQTVQQHVVAAQTREMTGPYRLCRVCHREQRLKDYRVRRLDTVLGTVRFRSPRLIACDCQPPCFMELTFCPFMFLIPERATPELQRLQASLASEVSYRRAAEILGRFLPVSTSHNHATIRNRTLRVGERLQAAGHCPPAPEPSLVKTPTEVTLAIDGGFVRSQSVAETRNFEVLTGRIAWPGKRPYVFAWVRSQGGPMQERLTSLLRSRTAAPAPQVTVITDGGNSVQHLHRLLPGNVHCVLDWFHVSMRVRYLEQIVAGLCNGSDTERYTKRVLTELASKLRWHFWHANAQKAWDSLWRILTLCRIVVSETAAFRNRLSHLDYRVREFFDYLEIQIVPLKLGRLADPCTAVVEEQQQRVVAPSVVRAPVGHADDQSDLFRFEVSSRPLPCLLRRNGQNSHVLQRMRHVVAQQVLEEAADRRAAAVTLKGDHREVRLHPPYCRLTSAKLKDRIWPNFATRPTMAVLPERPEQQTQRVSGLRWSASS
jgi:hypothetical protein